MARLLTSFEISPDITFDSSSMPGWVEARDWGEAHGDITARQYTGASGNTITVNALFLLGGGVRLSVTSGTPETDLPDTIKVSRGASNAIFDSRSNFAARGLGAQADYAHQAGSASPASVMTAEGSARSTIELLSDTLPLLEPRAFGALSVSANIKSGTRIIAKKAFGPLRVTANIGVVEPLLEPRAFGPLSVTAYIASGFPTAPSTHPLSDDQFDTWLGSSYAEPIVIAQLFYGENESDWVATQDFLTKPDDTPANLAIDGILESGVRISESLSEFNAGSLRIARPRGVRAEDYIARPWYGWPVRIYLGDERWPLSDFRLQANAVNGGLVQRGAFEYEFILEDAGDWLQFEIEGPRIYGLVNNIVAEIIDEANLEYRFRENTSLSGTIEKFEIRDSGVLLYEYGGSGNFWEANHITNYVINTARSKGTFRLPAQAAGTVTVTWGIADTVVLTDLLKPFIDDGKLTREANTVTNFPGNPIINGYWIPHRAVQTLGDILSRLVESASGSVRMNANGNLELYRLELPGTDAAVSITEDDILEDGLRLVEVQQPLEKITLRHSRNWHIHNADSLPASLTGTERLLLTVPFQDEDDITVLDDTDDYPKIKSRTYDTFSNGGAIGTELLRLANIRKQLRYVWEIDAIGPALKAEINDTVNVQYPDSGFEDGVNLRVIGRDRVLDEERVRLTCWR